MTDSPTPKPVASPRPSNETERLTALRRYRILDTPPEAAFDRITRLAARLFGMPTVLISLVDESRAWFKSCIGFDAREVPRDDTLCSFAVLLDEPLIVPDARQDDRFACNPFVQAEPGVRFYAGAPLLSQDGFNLGTLCLLDSQPHDPLTPEQQATLVDLAALVVDELELRSAAHRSIQSEEKYRTLFESIDEGFCTIEVLFDANDIPFDHRVLQANPAFEQQCGIANPEGKTASELVPGIEQFWNNLYAQVIQTGESIRTEIHSDVFDRWFQVLVSRVGDAALHQVAIVFSDISERKQAQVTLQQTSNELERQVRKFDAIAAAVPDFIYTFDLTGRFTFVNQPLLDLWQKTLDEALGKNFLELDYPTDLAARLQDQIQQVIEMRQPIKDETLYTTSVGTGVYEYVLVPLLDADGTVEAVAGVTRDITDRKSVEETLRESEERFRNMADNAPVMLWVTDPTGYCTYLSQRWYNFTGQTEATGLGFGWLSRVHPDDQEMSAQIFLNANQRQEAFVLEYRLQNQQGEYIWAIDAASPWFGMEGQFKGYIGSVLDISDRKRVEDERKQAEVALRESESRLRLALESAELGRWDFNPVTGVLQWDEQCKTMFGLSPEVEVNYEIFLAGLHPDDRDQTDQVVQYSLNPESGGEYAIEYRTIGIEDGIERWITAKGKAFFSPAGLAIRFIGTVLNMTGQKRAAAERERLLHQEQAAREEAERANRVKDEFLAVLSHELRSPLNPILGWARLLQNGKLDTARQTEALKTIERNAKLQSQLIEDLLDISRIMQGKLTLNATPVSLPFVIAAAIETVRLAAEAKQIEILLDLAASIQPISGDAARLQQVVWNLLTNAVKFTPTGGQVTIELRQIDQRAQLCVMDTGKGIDLQFLPHVFEYFRQEDGSTTRRFGGLGLGLAIVRQIVELHGGTVQAESQGENQGATFRVQLPVLLQAPSSLTEPTYSPTVADRPLDQIQILLVDDDTDTREFQAFLLEHNGARVMAVGSGLEALEVLDRWIPDVLVSDVGMAEMDGHTLIQQIRSRPPAQGGTIPAISLTAYAAEVDQQKAMRAGFQVHLTKPVEPDRLVESILNLLGG